MSLSSLHQNGLTQADFATLKPETQRALISLDHTYALADDLLRGAPVCDDCGSLLTDDEANSTAGVVLCNDCNAEYEAREANARMGGYNNY